MDETTISAIAAAATTALLAAWSAYSRWRTSQQAARAQRAQPIIDQAPPSLQPFLDAEKLRISPALLEIVVGLACKIWGLEELVGRIPELEKQIEEKNAEIAKLKQQRDSDQARIAELEKQVADLQRQLDEARGGCQSANTDALE